MNSKLIFKLFKIFFFFIFIIFLFYFYSSYKESKLKEELISKHNQFLLEQQQKELIKAKSNNFDLKINQEKHIFDYLKSNKIIH